jgi:hypothetical protein
MADLPTDAMPSLDAQLDAIDEVESVVDATAEAVTDVEAPAATEAATTEAPAPPAADMATMVATAVAQAMKPLLERLTPAATPEIPPTPAWELSSLEALQAPMPEHASARTRAAFAKAAQGLSQWESVAKDPSHERHADGVRMVAHYRERMAEAHHAAASEAQIKALTDKVEALSSRPQVDAAAATIKTSCAKPDFLRQAGYANVAAKVEGGMSLDPLYALVEWSAPDHVAQLERLMVVADLVAGHAPAASSKPAVAPAPKHNAAALPPRGAKTTTQAQHAGFRSIDEQLADMNWDAN